MYRKTKYVDWCQCCQQGVAFTDFKCSSDLLRDHDSSQIVHSSDNASCFHISFSFTDVGVRIPTGASALGMTWKYDSHSDYQPQPSLRASAHTGVAIRSPTIILQITMLLFVKGEDLYFNKNKKQTNPLPLQDHRIGSSPVSRVAGNSPIKVNIAQNM